MTKHESVFKESMVEMSFDEVFDLTCPVTGLISEEKKPSLYSLSLTESVCSDSIMDRPVCCQHSSALEDNVNNEEPFKTIGQIEDSLIETDDNIVNKFRKCASLHDVSNMIPQQMAPKSVNTVSCETIHSQSLSSTTKSKDSGFNRSVSCLSLTSGKRNYDHIESKVKAYIRNIKESEALRKKNKLIAKCEVFNNPEITIADNQSDMIMDKEDLLIKIQELKQELNEKSLYIDTQQKNYNSLLLKFAEAKNTIDALRLQRISLDYSSFNESRNRSSSIKNVDFDAFLQEINKSKRTAEAFINYNSVESNFSRETCINQKQLSPPSNTSNNFLTGDFNPKKHSTPNKSEPCRCLSPVSKLFSSSFRLDAQREPLESIHKSTSGTISKPAELLKNSGKKSKLSDLKIINKKKLCDAKQKKESSPKKKHQSQYIDVPYVDPFDKVKKWQASLPNINLLGTQSSSDHEDSHLEKDGEINSLLSEALVNKCKISEMKVKSPLVHQNSKECNEREKLCPADSNKDVKPFCYIGDNISDSVRQATNPQMKSVKMAKDVCNSNNKIGGLVSNEAYKSKFSSHISAKSNSDSDSESQSYIPRSSSISHRGHTLLENDMSDDSTDYSSSMSSSGLGSSRCLPSKKSKRKHMKNICNLLNKVPKLGAEKSGCSNFVLREPRLTVTIHNERFSTDQRRLESTSPSSDHFSSSTLNLKTESSERRAWNARNKTNFNVCQEFYYKQKSITLQNCITVMEEMVKESFPIIDNVLERSICK